MTALGYTKFSDRQDTSRGKINRPDLTRLQIVGSSLSPRKPIKIQSVTHSQNWGNAHDPDWIILFFDQQGIARLWDQSKHGGYTELIEDKSNGQ